MAEKIPLARPKEEGQPMLLARSSSGVPIYSTPRRIERETPDGDVKRKARRKAVNPKKKSQSNAKAESGDGKRGRKRGRTYSLRDTIRTIEGANRPSGRSAKELGITWLADRCEESPVSKAHYLVGRTKIDNGTIFECKYCHRVKWLPNSYEEASRLGNWLHIYGQDGGYQRILDLHPAAKRMISKIQDIYYLRKSIPPDQFPIAVAAIILDREYPHDVEIEEEDVLW